MKQTAVEWFSNQSWKLKIQLENKEISIGEYAVTYVKLVDEAREMERANIIDAYLTNPLEAKWKNIGTDYYNETFNANEK
jgi:hypothetical protein